jgi:hypothetical protein
MSRELYTVPEKTAEQLQQSTFRTMRRDRMIIRIHHIHHKSQEIAKY